MGGVSANESPGYGEERVGLPPFRVGKEAEREGKEPNPPGVASNAPENPREDSLLDSGTWGEPVRFSFLGSLTSYMDQMDP